MPSPDYTPTVWVDDDDPPVSADNLNHLEDGVEGAHERIDTFGDTFTGGWEPGDVKVAAYSVPSAGWLLCDGVPVSRATYAALFARIGTTYGVGDGSTTFNLPDGRGRSMVIKGTHAEVDQLGENDGVAVANRRGTKHRHTPHDHVVTGGRANDLFNVASQPGALAASRGATVDTSPADGGSGVATDPLDGGAFIVFNCFIKT